MGARDQLVEASPLRRPKPEALSLTVGCSGPCGAGRGGLAPPGTDRGDSGWYSLAFHPPRRWCRPSSAAGHRRSPSPIVRRSRSPSPIAQRRSPSPGARRQTRRRDMQAGFRNLAPVKQGRMRSWSPTRRARPRSGLPKHQTSFRRTRRPAEKASRQGSRSPDRAGKAWMPKRDVEAPRTTGKLAGRGRPPDQARPPPLPQRTASAQ